MGFWIYMLLIDLLIPAIMFLTGLVFTRKVPPRLNGIFGYRTRRSMVNQDTWLFANRYMGKIWFHWGMILLPLSVVPMLFVLDDGPDRISLVSGIVCILQLIPVLASIWPVERALRDNFDRAGNRIQKTFE